ncbi:RAB11-binding protein RELCH-like [Schistocerca gregaria]|uniref:RAB11-binding protein RELCH-like n=1 Tax=Schistocerca gregaria TaxID=7010 RepID=UPI00211E86B2|nr:RAB11-binding protein RELCH-like [Schistocerca gregaria]
MDVDEELKEISQIFKFLVRNEFFLTCLELYQECVERGQIVSSMKELFTMPGLKNIQCKKNPGLPAADLIPIASFQGTKDKLPDPISSSDLIRKNFILEQELKKERKALQDLRISFSELLVSNYLTLHTVKEDGVESLRIERPTSKTEVEVVNYLIEKYMNSQGYKMSSIAFTSEVGQKFEEWAREGDSVGVKVPEPVSIVWLYRSYYGISRAIGEDNREDLYSVIEELCDIVEKLRVRTMEVERILMHGEERSRLRRESLDGMGMEKKGKKKVANVSLEDGWSDKVDESRRKIESVTGEMVRIPIRGEVEKIVKRCNRNYGFFFAQNELQKGRDGKMESQLNLLRSSKNEEAVIVSMLGDTIPEIMYGLVLEKRERLVPVILSVICCHPEERKRMEMTSVLFALFRTPDERQRKIIVDGFIHLAQKIGKERTSLEILPVIAEAVLSDVVERRVLCAEICGWLSVCVEPKMRLSLLLSILQQLLGDRSPSVQLAVAVNLGRVLIVGESELDEERCECLDDVKYQQIVEFVKELLNVEDIVALQVVRVTLIPILGDFLDRYGVLREKLLPDTVEKLREAIERRRDKSEDFGRTESVQVLTDVLICLCPLLYEIALMESGVGEPNALEYKNEGLRRPEGSRRYMSFVSAFSEKRKKSLRKKFDCWVNERSDEALIQDDLRILRWYVHDLVSKMVSVACEVESDQAVIGAICSLLAVFGQEFGEALTSKVTQPFFESEINRLSEEAEQGNEDGLEKRAKLMTIYIGGVLSVLKGTQLQSCLRDKLVKMSTGCNGWNMDHFGTFESSLDFLIKHFPEHRQTLLSSLWELIIYEDERVRNSVLRVLRYSIPYSNPSELSSRIIPALMTMSSDSDIRVRCGVISIFGDLLKTEDIIKVDKITTHLSSLLDECYLNFKIVIQCAKTLVDTIPFVTPELRDKFVLPQIIKLAKRASEEDDLNRQKELADVLCEGYDTLSRLSVTKEVIRQHVLPGLTYLQKTSEVLTNEKRKAMSDMIAKMRPIAS